MPREQINYRPEYGIAVDPGCNPDCGVDHEHKPETSTVQRDMTAPIVHVGWHKDGYLQVALQYDKAKLQALLDDYDPAEDGSVMLFTADLGRTATNKLIRVVRRGRDQAYGRDE